MNQTELLLSIEACAARADEYESKAQTARIPAVQERYLRLARRYRATRGRLILQLRSLLDSQQWRATAGWSETASRDTR